MFCIGNTKPSTVKDALCNVKMSNQSEERRIYLYDLDRGQGRTATGEPPADLGLPRRAAKSREDGKRGDKNTWIAEARINSKPIAKTRDHGYFHDGSETILDFTYCSSGIRRTLETIQPEGSGSSRYRQRVGYEVSPDGSSF
ncbi:hypothetical protein BHM03_00010416 [Ensete ventricosum]|uniref:Uncharacterized protein n=1 Tax=Ensete ventricosum TaxID=4639 RepID=A0A445MCY9_ENSVE|nr:hypothetical protein BHM03_00010416 [Ensete ventricosum]